MAGGTEEPTGEGPSLPGNEKKDAPDTDKPWPNWQVALYTFMLSSLMGFTFAVLLCQLEGR